MKLTVGKVYYLEVDRLGDSRIIDKNYGVFLKEEKDRFIFNDRNEKCSSELCTYTVDKDKLKIAKELSPIEIAQLLNDARFFVNSIMEHAAEFKQVIQRKRKKLYETED